MDSMDCFICDMSAEMPDSSLQSLSSFSLMSFRSVSVDSEAGGASTDGDSLFLRSSRSLCKSLMFLSIDFNSGISACSDCTDDSDDKTTVRFLISESRPRNESSLSSRCLSL